MNLRTLIRRRWTANPKTHRELSHRLSGFHSLEDRVVPAPLAGVGLSVAPDPLIGEQNVPVSVTFTNAGADPGYGPWTYVVLPASGADGIGDGISYVNGSATFLGAPITADILTKTGPGTSLTVTGPAAAYALNASGAPITINGLSNGDQVLFFQLPYISFASNQPNATVNFRANVSNQANLDVGLTVQAGGGFTLGADPLNNPGTDAPQLAAIVNQVSTPELVRITKTYIGPEQETATGPNWTRQYRIDAYVAPNQTISGFELRDILDRGMQFREDLPVTGTATGSSSFAVSGTADASQPGGTVIGTFDLVTGDASASSVDASMTFSFFVPRENSSGGDVVPLATGDFQSLTDTAGANGSWTNGFDVDDPGVTAGGTYWDAAVRNPTDIITAKSIAVQKGVSVVGGGDPQQGAVLEYTIEFQISDYFAFDQLNIPDLLPDGVRFQGSFVPTLSINGGAAVNFSGGNYAVGTALPTVGGNADGTQSLNFNVSGQIGGAGRLLGGWIPVGGTGGALPDDSASFGNSINPGSSAFGTIVFRAVVQNLYTDPALPPPNNNVKQGDSLTNFVPTTTPPNLPGGTQPAGGRVLEYDDAATATGNQQADDTSATVTIPTGTLTKTIYAINGDVVPVGPVPNLQNGDTVTYRLTYVLPTSSVQNFRLTDYLPLPVFNATQVTTFVTGPRDGTAPVAGTAWFGPGTGAPGGAIQYGDGTISGQGNPTIATNGTANTVQFSFPQILQDDAQRTTFVDILFTVTITDAPFADGFPLTNQANAREGNTSDDATQGDQINQVILGRPNLTVTKGVVASDRTGLGSFGNGGGSFNGPGAGTSFGGTVSSSGLDSSAINTNIGLPGIDAGDRVQFAVVVENTGSGHRGAYDILINDTIPSGFSTPTGGPGRNLQFRDGTGAGGDYTAATAAGFLFFNSVGTQLFNQADVEAAFFSVGGLRISGTGPTTAGTFDTNAGLLDAFNATSGRNILVITYDLEANGTVVPNQSLPNTATVTSYASQPNGDNKTPTNVGDLDDNATVRVRVPLVDKDLVGTELTAPGNNGPNQATIGEYVTYTVTITLPEGTIPGAQLVDTLQAGLGFVDVLSITPSTGVTFTGTPGTPGVAGQVVTFDFGTITNADRVNGTLDTITITYRALVSNVVANQAGQTRINSANFNWTGATDNVGAVQAGQQSNENASISGTPTPVTIVEPTVTADKLVQNVTDSSGFVGQVRADAGDTIRYQITLTSGSTTAYGVALSDTLPTAAFNGLFSIVGFSVSGGNVYLNDPGTYTTPHTLTAADFQIVGGVLSFLNPGTNVYDLDPGVTITLTLEATDFRGTIGSLVANTATTTWTSLPHTLPGNPDDRERNGTGGVNDYTDSEDANIESPPLVHKSIVETSESSTSPGSISAPGVTGVSPTVDGAIGELVRYRLYVSIPETTAGTPISSLQIQDALPNGLLFVNDGSARYTFLGSGGSNPFSSSLGSLVYLDDSIVGNSLLSLSSGQILGLFGSSATLGVSGQTATFSFGDVQNENRDLSLEFLVIEFNALVQNVAGNQAGTQLDNTFTVLSGGNTIGVVQDGGQTGTPDGIYSTGDVDAMASNFARVTVREPNLTVNKQTTITSGNQVTYSVTVTNNGTATAFGVVIQDDVDTPPEGLTLVSVSGLTLAGGATGGTAAHDIPNGLVRFDSSTTQLVIPVGGSVTFTYVANVTLTPTGTDSIDNTVSVTYESLDGNGSLITNTTVNPRGAAGTSTGERTGQDGPGGLNDYVISDTERLGSLGDRVYFDADGDGVQDAGEAGLVGVEVVVRWAGPNALFDGDDQYITATTGANGIWTVTGLPLGASQFYRISVPATLSGMGVTDVGNNGGPANPDPFGLGVGVSAITLTGVDEATTNNRIQDFGYRGTASLGNRIYVDADGDGVQDANGLEPSLPGVEVVLTWGGLDGIVGGGNAADDLTFTVTSTAAAGTGPNYLFSNLPAGSYTVAVATTGGVGGVPLNSVLTDSVDDTTLTPAGTVPATLTMGQAADQYDFGFQGNASFGNYVWYDVDGDGVQESNEPPIQGAVVTAVWFGPNGTVGGGDDVTFTTTTDANGLYTFPGIPANALNGTDPNYRVTVTPPAEYPTLSDSIDDGVLSPTVPVDIQVSPVNGDPLNDRTDVDFGFRGTAQLGNFVWHDLNGNGRQDGGLEVGLDGVTVDLYFDHDNDGTFDLLATTVTAGGGAYNFGNLAAGNYQVVFGTLPGFERTYANSPVATSATNSDADRTTGRTGTYTLALGTTNDTVDAGLFIPISLGDRVWYDVDADGVQDPTNEPGISDVPITVVWLGVDGLAGGTGDAADVTYSTSTGANGIWEIDELPPGQYTVTAGTPPNGLTTLTDSINNGGAPSPVNPVTITAVSGVDRDDIDFGFVGTSSLGDRVWLDVDADGVQDANGLEPGIPGLPVTLVWFGQDGIEGTTTDNVTLTTVTGADGIYGFPNLPTGSYRVTVDPTAGGTSNLAATYDLDSTTVAPDGTTVATIPNPGDDITNVDFGYVGNASVGDRVWIDQNQDGVQDPFEPGIVGAVIELVSGGVDNDLGTPGDNLTMTVTTGANGNYLFNGVPVFNGTTPYRATVISLPFPGFTPTYDLDGTTVTPNGIAVFDVTDTGGPAPSTQNRRDVDFGYDGGGTLQGTVYRDDNDNGIQGIGEPGIAGVRIVLTGVDNFGNPVLDPITGNPYETLTDADGNYFFANVIPGTYTITEYQPAAYNDGQDAPGTVDGTPSGTASTTPPSPPTPLLDQISGIVMGSNSAGIEYNFGEIGTFVSGTVFRDAGLDGLLDPNDPGIAGIVIELRDATGTTVLATAVTDQNGYYIFPNIPAGDYLIREIQPVGYANTPTGSFQLNDRPVTVPLDGLINQNYGEVLGSLSGVVYLDQNNNGSQQAGEPGLSGVTVVLTGTDAAGAAVNRTAITDSTGAYTFDNLLAGTYTIVEFQPTRYADGLDGQNNPGGVAGSLGGTIGNDVLGAIALPAGGAGVNYNFGETPPITPPNTSSLSGTVWLDLDKDGTIDPNETGIPGVLVTLTGPGGISLTATTGPDGSYLFTNLPAGNYTVTETQPSEYGTTTPNVVNATIPPTLVPVTGVDFGEAPGTISGTVYIDFDDSGTREAGEPPIAGVVVTLTGTDVNGNPILRTTTTDEFGNYRFTGLPASDVDGYTVTQTQPPAFVSGPDNASGTLGGTANGPNEFETIFVPPGGDGTEYNFGENNPSAAGTTFISGTVWLDRNRDGVFDPTEQGIPGVIVQLLDANGTVIDSTTTGSDGSYTFLDVVPGSYTVREQELTDPALAPWGSSTPDEIPVFVPPSLVPVTGLNFGETPAAIAGSTYLDADNDGVRDPGEFGIGGVTVVLTGTDVNGNPVERTTTTNPAGFYQFDDLPASDTDGYTVTQTQPLGYQDGLDGQDNGTGTAGSLGGVINDDVLTTIVVPAGEIGNQYNFGERGPNSVSGFVYLDYDLSGDFDPTGQDVPFGGGSVTLNNGNTTAQPAITLTTPPFLVVLTGVDAQGNLINLSTITAPDGSYSFGNLPAGTYTIYQSIPITPILVNDTMISGLYNGLDTLGSLGGTNANSMDNELGVTLTGDGSVANPAQNGTDYNFGELPPADPFGFVYVDENANGVLDAGEPGIAGVPITISGIAFAGTPFARPLTAADVPGGSLTIFTDANGRWEFVPIPPGLYTIVQSAQPAGFFDGVEQNADPNGQPGGPVVVGNDVFSNINVQPFPIRGPFNFGELRPSSISGTVYQDLNRNGVRDAGEPGIGGVQMTLTGTVASLPGINPGQRGAGVGPTVVFTDANGNFTFGGLLPGTYALAEAQPIPFAQGTNAPGSSGGIFLGTDIIGLINLGPGVNAVNYLFGEVNPLGTNPEPVPPVGPLPPVTSIAPGTPTKRSFLASTPYSDGTERVDPNYAALGSLGAPGANQFLSTADGVGGELVRVFDLTRGVERFRLRPFPGNPGGTRAVQGDITGDGVPDTVAVPAAGGTPRVVVYDGNNAAIRSSFFAFEESFTGGLFVATGDLNNDGFDDIVVSADVGGGPRVKVFDGRTGSLLADFWGIEDPNFRGGARIAIGDVNGDGQLDLIVAAGVGGGPRVSIFDGASVIAGNPTRLVADFYAFEQTLTNGVYISAGDVNGDGFADLAFGAGPGGAPRVTGIDGSSLIAGRITPVFDFFVGDANARGGVPVHLQDIDNDGRSELITGTAAGQTSLVKIFDVGNGPGRELDEFYANWKDFLGGVFVG